MNIHKFDPVIYPYKLWIVISKKSSCVSELFYNNDGSDIAPIDLKNIDAFTIPVIEKKNKNVGVVILFPSKKNISFKNVAHEASHAAKMLFEYIKADIREHEPFEYVVGWIAGCCDNVKKERTKP